LGLSVTLATRKPLPCFTHWPMGNGSVKIAFAHAVRQAANLFSGRWKGQTNGVPTCGLFLEIASRHG